MIRIKSNDKLIIDFITENLNQLEYYGLMINFFWRSESINIDIDSFYLTYQNLLTFVEKFVDEKEVIIEGKYIEFISIEEIILAYKSINPSNNIGSLYEFYKEKKDDVIIDKSILSLVHGYYFNWKNFSNPAILKIGLNLRDSDSISIYNYSIYCMVEELISSNCIEDYILVDLKRSVSGYILGSDILKNRIYSRLRLYLSLNKESVMRLSSNKFHKITKDVSILYKKKHKSDLLRVYNFIYKFIQNHIKEANSSLTQAEVLEYQIRIYSVIKLAQSIYSDFYIYKNNVMYKYFDDLIQEINSDLEALKTTSIFQHLKVPKYVHWLYPPRNEFNINFLSKLREQRIFMCKPLFDEIESKRISSYKEAASIANKRYIDLHKSFVIIFSKILNRDLWYLREKIFSEEDFNSKFTNNDSKEIKPYSLYEVYDIIGEIDKKYYNGNVFKTHISLCQEEIEPIMEENAPNSFKEYQVKIEKAIILFKKYPFNYRIPFAISIWYQIIGDNHNSLAYILEAILLNNQNEHLWETLSIILEK